MKTIQFILSFIFVAVLASCSADSDVLNEMEENNQLPSNDKVTVTLSLSTGVATRGAEDETQVPFVGEEGTIRNSVALIFGENDQFLAKVTNDAQTLSIKKQRLTIYAIANFNDADENVFADFTTIAACEDYKPESFVYENLANTLPTAMPKSGYTTVNLTDKNASATINVQLTQLTARIDPPAFPNSNYTLTSLTIGDNTITNLTDFPLYVYPGNLSISLIAKYGNGNSYSFDGGSRNFAANTIYQPTLKLSDPKMPAALWIDWYVAQMEQKDVTAEVGGSEA